ncbi:MAG: PspC domain-containing protein [Anaerolineales bacterium]|jgi:phage shock protein PspC (stress-responsive transcriptional regulator)
MAVEKRLYRSRDERMIAGVCGGLGEYLSIDPTIIRLLFVLSTFWGGSGFIAYLVMMVLIPEEPLERVKAEPEPAIETVEAESE